ncbi:outer membrane beta-barrel protein, partial [candidate division GN15 bacterium]|nr:outer membrane beta-barrel protein [candidate division GN15 bacterium]
MKTEYLLPLLEDMMKKASITVLVVTTLVLLMSLPAAAQNKTGLVGWGLRGGFDISNVVGSDAKYVGDLPYKTKAGFTGAIWAVWGISERFAIQPEVVYSMKGTRVLSGENRLELTMNYVEFPILLKMR